MQKDQRYKYKYSIYLNHFIIQSLFIFTFHSVQKKKKKKNRLKFVLNRTTEKQDNVNGRLITS